MIARFGLVVWWLASLLGLAPFGAALADPGVGLVVDAAGAVFVADPGSNRIWRVDPDGQASVLLSDRHSHLLRLEQGTLLRGEHLVYRSDQRWDSRFWTYDLSAKQFRWSSPVLTDAMPFADGQTLHLDGQGAAYSWLWAAAAQSSQILRRRLPDGRIEILGRESWLPSEQATPDDAMTIKARTFRQIVSLAFDAQGNTLIVQMDQADWLNAQLVQKTIIRRDQIPARGNMVPVPDFLNRFFGALVGPDGERLIADAGTRQVVAIGTLGQIRCISPLADAYFPVGLAARDGWLYVLEYPDPGTNHSLRVRRLRMTETGRGQILGYLQG